MNRFAPIAFTSCLALVMPAFAQSQTGTSPSTTKSGSASTMSQSDMKSGMSQSGSKSTMSADDLRKSQEDVKSALEKGGFQQISVLDAAYLVHAHTGDGLPVTMWVDPDRMQATSGGTSSTGMGSASTGTGTSGSGTAAQKSGTASRMSDDDIRKGQEQLKSSLEKAGFEQVQVMDAAYLVHAHTDGGTPVTTWVEAGMTDRHTGARSSRSSAGSTGSDKSQ